MSLFHVKFAVYGALENGNQDSTSALNVKEKLQELLYDGSPGIVQITNSTMGADPALGNKKHFGAVVAVDKHDRYFACEENQTIDFNHFLE